MNAPHETAEVTRFCGPERLYRVRNRVQITLLYHDAVPGYLPATWNAVALGWYRITDLVGTCPDRETLARYVRDRFPDCEIEGVGSPADDRQADGAPLMIARPTEPR